MFRFTSATRTALLLITAGSRGDGYALRGSRDTTLKTATCAGTCSCSLLDKDSLNMAFAKNILKCCGFH